MKKLSWILISFILCAVLDVWRGWFWFFPVYLIFSYRSLEASSVWEIPLGCLSASVMVILFSSSEAELFRALIPCAALLIAVSTPKKLAILFPIAIIMLCLKNDIAGIHVMAAAIVCSFHRKRVESRKLYHNTSPFTRAISKTHLIDF